MERHTLRTILLCIISIVIGTNVFSQDRNTINGKVISINNPCTTDPCLPGCVVALSTDSISYILTNNHSWSDDSITFDGNNIRVNDSIKVVGVVYEKVDIHTTTYYELEIEEVFLLNPVNSHEYQTVFGNTNTWKIVVQFETTYTESYTTKKDTIIDNKSYKIFGYSDFENELAFIREDSLEEKIYIRPIDDHNDTNEYVMYDFSLQEGDSIELYQIDHWQNQSMGFYSVDSVEYVNLLGRERKKIFLTGKPYVYPLQNEKPVWLEGIGSLGHFLYPAISVDVWNLGELSCFFKNDSLIYHSPDFNTCDVWTSIKNISHNIFDSYPNPTNNFLTIRSEYSKPVNLRLMNMQGQIVYSRDKQLILNKTIDLSSIKEGNYLLQILGDNFVVRQIIIKQRGR